MTANFKSFIRLFKNHITRFLTIIAIVIVSVGFMSGIGEVENKIKIATEQFYISQNISDLYIKSHSLFSEDDINKLKEEFGENNIQTSFSYEIKIEDDIVRVYNFNFNHLNINKISLLQGELPHQANQVVVERRTSKIKGYKINDKINLNGQEFEVCGIVLNPLILNEVEEPSFMFEGEHLDNVVYINSPSFTMVNDVYVTIENRGLFNSFSNNYEKEIKALKTKVNSLFDNNVTTLSLFENFGLFSLVEYAEKVGEIGIIFVVFFMLVTLLVVYSTMSRLLDEERGQIACLKTLGHSNFKIVLKYTLFVFFASVIGGLLAFGVGYALTDIIYTAFNLQYHMPPFPSTINFLYYLMTFLIVLIGTSILTCLTGASLAKNKPATLLIPKSPKSGKKVFIEKIPFVWNKLSFKYKATLRNVLLFKSRFFMTVVSIMGSTVLVFSGMGLLDCSLKIAGSGSLIAISIALIIFSAVLCALVIYNITNINISERKREIATLKVLGYHDKESANYIYREIYIMSFIGAILGLPLGLGFIEFVFGLISFGAVSDINWWTYLLTPLISMFFSFISTKLLYKKIAKTDMNSSLKILE